MTGGAMAARRSKALDAAEGHARAAAQLVDQAAALAAQHRPGVGAPLSQAAAHTALAEVWASIALAAGGAR